jgi:hypothetical protein
MTIVSIIKVFCVTLINAHCCGAGTPLSERINKIFLAASDILKTGGENTPDFYEKSAEKSGGGPLSPPPSAAVVAGCCGRWAAEAGGRERERKRERERERGREGGREGGRASEKELGIAKVNRSKFEQDARNRLTVSRSKFE